MVRIRFRQALAQGALAIVGGLAGTAAHASLFQGETLDKVANFMSWVVLVLVPLVAIAIFWLVHIMPEKIAERRRHPQLQAIKALCLLSLFFGGLLWPLAWLWAYSKPVLYKMAYGTDVADGAHGAGTPAPVAVAVASPESAGDELARLRERLTSLERRLGREARD